VDSVQSPINAISRRHPENPKKSWLSNKFADHIIVLFGPFHDPCGMNLMYKDENAMPEVLLCLPRSHCCPLTMALLFEVEKYLSDSPYCHPLTLQQPIPFRWLEAASLRQCARVSCYDVWLSQRQWRPWCVLFCGE